MGGRGPRPFSSTTATLSLAGVPFSEVDALLPSQPFHGRNLALGTTNRALGTTTEPMCPAGIRCSITVPMFFLLSVFTIENRAKLWTWAWVRALGCYDASVSR